MAKVRLIALMSVVVVVPFLLGFDGGNPAPPDNGEPTPVRIAHRVEAHLAEASVWKDRHSAAPYSAHAATRFYLLPELVGHVDPEIDIDNRSFDGAPVAIPAGQANWWGPFEHPNVTEWLGEWEISTAIRIWTESVCFTDGVYLEKPSTVQPEYIGPPWDSVCVPSLRTLEPRFFVFRDTTEAWIGLPFKVTHDCHWVGTREFSVHTYIFDVTTGQLVDEWGEIDGHDPTQDDFTEYRLHFFTLDYYNDARFFDEFGNVQCIVELTMEDELGGVVHLPYIPIQPWHIN